MNSYQCLNSKAFKRRQGQGVLILNVLGITEGKIYDVLNTISPREREVLINRYGLDGAGPETLAEVGKRFSVSRSRIQQIEAKALRKLRHPTRLKPLGVKRIGDE